MTEFEDRISPEDTASKSDESIAPVSEETPMQAPKPESQARSTIRNIVRWTLSLLIAFGLGALVVYFVYLVPIRRNLDQNITELDQATQQVDSLTDQLEEITKIKQELELELIEKQVHITILDTLSDVRAANLAVSTDDYAGALLSLRNANQSLEQLDDSIGEDQGEVITTLQNDVSEIEDMLKDDPEGAKEYLDRLIENLINLERTISK